jgi:endogenous inhibitor of DNA gyrase (YacG/DUF329 family)
MFTNERVREMEIRFAQEKGGQKLHIVPVIQGDTVANTALCGKQVRRWRMTCNLPLAYCCKNCNRIDKQRGHARALEIFKAVVAAMR